ncbi:hypothetical protein GCM10010174_82520 [Kutzneria viridogrisea]|uniref:Transcriptional regulator with XRE-family HTH domain n=1 Tax=Kutzneria viridogrisea TaxID=47990 RepID=A0ABR6BEU9_9PSEU|nr:transcriptional regulator with XRE-family HTH domain [Kutzneria viridogrisea]
MTSGDRLAGVELLRRLRESRGWSWADLARALQTAARRLGIASVMQVELPSIVRTLARWESVTGTSAPRERYQVLLAHIYAYTPAGSLHMGPGSDFAVLTTALRHLGTPPKRLVQITTLVTQAANTDNAQWLVWLSPAMQAQAAAVLKGERRLDEELLQQLAGSVAGVARQVGNTPFGRLQLQLAPIVELCRLLLKADSPSNELLVLASDATALAARLAFELADDEVSMALYQEATNTAGELPERFYRAAILTSRTMVTLHATGSPHAAADLAREAVAEAHRGASYTMRARAHAIHAELRARTGDHTETQRALNKAWTTVDQLTEDDPCGGFNATRLAGFDGLCALHVGDAVRAHDQLALAVSALDGPGDLVQRGIVSTDLALARLRLNSPDACAELMHQAVDITAHTGGRVSGQRIRQVRQALRPWRSESFVLDLDDHIHDALIGR